VTDIATTGTDPELAAMFAGRPRVRTDLLFSRELGRGPDRVHLLRIRGGRMFEVTAKEYFLIRRLDGQRSLAEISEEYAARFARRLGVAQWSQLLWLLHQRDLLEAGDDAPTTVTPSRALARLATAFGWFFSAPAQVIVGIGLLAMYAYVAMESPRLWQAAGPAFGDWRALAVIVVISYVSAMLHELGHAVAATRFGCPAVRINLLTLTCRVEDYQFLPSRGRQVTIAAVGGVLNSLVVAPFVLFWLTTTPGSAGHRFAAAVILVGAAQSLVNYVPVAPLDGYKALSHLLGMVALSPESRRYLWSRPRQWMTRRGPQYPPRARIVLGLYGTAWHVATAAAGIGLAYAGGRPLEQWLGRAAYAASAAAVLLMITMWLVSRPLRPARTHTNQPTK
jgi:putative peptide zinc metalloprotease protein